MSDNTEIKHLRTRTYDLISDACVSGTPDMYQEAHAFSDMLCMLILASGPDALTLLLESLERGLNRGEFRNGDAEDGYNSAVALQEAKELLELIKAA